jgi:hypothetical protein
MLGGCTFDGSGLPVTETFYAGYCLCVKCTNRDTTDPQQCAGAWVVDGAAQPVTVCADPEEQIAADQQKRQELVGELRGQCENQLSFDLQECNLVPVYHSSITETPPPAASHFSDLVTVADRFSCQRGRSLNDHGFYGKATPRSTRYTIDTSKSWLDLTFNGQTARTSVKGTFLVDGEGCYDGVTATSCAQSLNHIALRGLNDILLGGDYDISSIVVVNVGTISGAVTNLPNNRASGTAQLGSEGSGLLISGSQINHNLRRVGVFSTLQNDLVLDIDYQNRTFVLEGPLELSFGEQGYLYLEGSTDNHMPVADAGPDQQVCMPEVGRWADVTMAGRFIDPDSDDTYQSVVWWNESGVLMDSNDLSPTLRLGLGRHTLRLYVWDENDGTGDDTMVVDVMDCDW